MLRGAGLRVEATTAVAAVGTEVWCISDPWWHRAGWSMSSTSPTAGVSPTAPCPDTPYPARSCSWCASPRHRAGVCGGDRVLPAWHVVEPARRAGDLAGAAGGHRPVSAGALTVPVNSLEAYDVVRNGPHQARNRAPNHPDYRSKRSQKQHFPCLHRPLRSAVACSAILTREYRTVRDDRSSRHGGRTSTCGRNWSRDYTTGPTPTPTPSWRSWPKIAAAEIPGAQYAGITLTRNANRIETPAATHHWPLLLDKIQQRTCEGPA